MANYNERAKEAVMKYDIAGAAAVAKEAVDSGYDLIDLVNNGFTAGINEVGKLYEEKKVFLPHLMSAAVALNSGMDIIVPALESQGKATESKGKVVLCTIEGDIHSIGKDILAILVKVAGFDVDNLGKDVPVDDIVKACKDQKADIVATSALMTTTMLNQRVLEQKLKEAGIRNDVFTNVGGCPVTQLWADEIGADTYSESATEAVEIFEKLMESN